MDATITENFMDAKDADIAYQIRCKRSWMDRVTVAAKALGLSPAAYIRMVVTQRMNDDGTPHTETPKKPKK